jgi:hypothetical protein
MSEEKPRKKGHSVGLGKVVGITILALFVGMILGGYLSFTVVAPEFEKLHIDFGALQSNNGNGNNSNNNNNDQNNNQNNSQNNNNNNSDNPNIDNNNNNSNNNQNNNNNSSNNNNNQTQGPGTNNNNPSPSNPTASYGGSGQFDVSIQNGGSSFSGTLSANINVSVEQNGNTIQFSLDLTPTSVSGSLSQVIQTGGSDTIFNFVGTTSGSQVNANSQGTTGSGQSFNLNLSGSIDSNTFSFKVTSASGSQLNISTPQQIVTNDNA